MGDAREAWKRAGQRWPEVTLSFDAFSAALERASCDAGAPHAEELYFARALELGDKAALAHFEQNELKKVRRHLHRFGLDEDRLDDVLQRLREKLLVGAQAKNASYSGKGSFGAWLRVIASREALNHLRQRESMAPEERDRDLRGRHRVDRAAR